MEQLVSAAAAGSWPAAFVLVGCTAIVCGAIAWILVSVARN